MAKSTQVFGFSLKVSVAISILGLVIIPLLLQQSGKFPFDFSFTKPLIGSLYAALCIIGLSAVFFPRNCEESFIVRTKSSTLKHAVDTQLSRIVRFEGHHPGCAEFSANRIITQEKVLCASCTGLLVGAIISLTGAILYFFAGLNFIPGDTRVLAVSYAGLFAGLAQFKFRRYAKMMANLFFVLGSFVTLIITDLLAGSVLVDLYVFGVIVFLLLTRIMISEWNNTRTCGRCITCQLV